MHSAILNVQINIVALCIVWRNRNIALVMTMAKLELRFNSFFGSLLGWHFSKLVYCTWGNFRFKVNKQINMLHKFYNNALNVKLLSDRVPKSSWNSSDLRNSSWFGLKKHVCNLCYMWTSGISDDTSLQFLYDCSVFVGWIFLLGCKGSCLHVIDNAYAYIN